MPTLEKAKLFKLKARKSDDTSDSGQGDTVGDPITVQFNPQTLKLTLANQLSDGKTEGTQTRQFLGKSSTELTFELQFDSADEAKGTDPVSVREKTQAVEALLKPDPSGDKPVPARVRFLWGDLRVDGLISSLAIDFELFAANGIPLRAKMGVTIKEQDARYETWQKKESANQGSGQGPTPAGPGTAGGKSGDLTQRTGIAQAGETAADFARRMGFDPSAWRGLAGAIDNPLSLTAGAQIDFAAQLSLGGGLTAQAGFTASANVSLEESFGVDGAPADLGQGFTLAAAGGVSAALETVKVLKAEGAASGARSAFQAPVPKVRPGQLGAGTVPNAVAGAARLGTDVQPGAPDQDRAPLRLSAAGAAANSTASTGAQVPFPQADPRSVSYGAGVPLRPLVGTPASQPVVVSPHQARPAPQGVPRVDCSGTGSCGCGCGGASWA